MAVFDSVSPKVAVPIAILFGGLLWTTRKASAKGTTTNPLACPPFGVIPRARVEELARTFAADGVRSIDILASRVATELYPKTPQGTVITWPLSPPFDPSRMTPSLRCLWTKIRGIVGELDLPEAPTDDPKAPARVLNQLLSSDPRTGSFFKVKKHEELNKPWVMAGELQNSIAYQALRRIDAAAARNDR